MVYSPQSLDQLTEDENKTFNRLLDEIDQALFTQSRSVGPNSYYTIPIKDDIFRDSAIVRCAVTNIYENSGWKVNLAPKESADRDAKKVHYLLCLNRSLQ